MAEEGIAFSREQGIRRGSHYYAYNGFYFHKYRDVNGTSYYRCAQSSCTARGIFKCGAFHETYSHSGHDSDYLRAEVLRERHRLINQASSLDFARVEDVLHHESNSNRRFGDTLTPKMLLPVMKNARLNTYPNEPDNLSDLSRILQAEQYRCISAVSQFEDNIFGGSAMAEDGSCSVLFVTKRCANFLKIASYIYAVSFSFGTYTVHTIGTVLDSIEIPLAWFLMDRETLAAFVAAFTLLRSHLITWTFKDVVCKDNGPESEAYRLVFCADVRAYLDYFIKDIGTTANTFFGTQVIQENKDVTSIIGLCCVLPILPQDLANQGFDFVESEVSKLSPSFQSAFAVLLHYLKSDWFYHEKRGPVFSMCGSSERTSNSMTSTLQRMTCKLQSNMNVRFYRCIDDLLKIESVSFKDISEHPNRPAARRVKSLSDDPQIVVLTRALARPLGTTSAGVINLLRAASAKMQLVINFAIFDQ